VKIFCRTKWGHSLCTVTYLFFVKGKVVCDDLGDRTGMKMCDTVRVGERPCDFVKINDKIVLNLRT